MSKVVHKICYAGIYPPTAPRDKVYLDELRHRGVSIVECVNTEPGLLKYRRLFRAISKESGGCDVVWVGYLSNFLVPVAYLASRKRIIYNALGASYEAYILDRAAASRFSIKAFLFWISDFLSFHLSDMVLLESESQKRYIARTFFVPDRKLTVIYTGADESLFHPDPNIKKNEQFTVAFRGMFIPATGVEIILEAIHMLKDEPIRFWISGWGQLQSKVVKFIEDKKLKNVELNTVFLEPDALRHKLLSAHLLLGQFSKHARLDRTIQHKTIEALALGQPLITRDSTSNREVLSDGLDAIFVNPGSAKELSEKILHVKSDEALRQRLSRGALETYKRKFSQKVLGDEVAKILYNVVHGD